MQIQYNISYFQNTCEIGIQWIITINSCLLKAARISIPQYINNIEQIKLIHSIYYNMIQYISSYHPGLANSNAWTHLTSRLIKQITY